MWLKTATQHRLFHNNRWSLTAVQNAMNSVSNTNHSANLRPWVLSAESPWEPLEDHIPPTHSHVLCYPSAETTSILWTTPVGSRKPGCPSPALCTTKLHTVSLSILTATFQVDWVTWYQNVSILDSTEAGWWTWWWQLEPRRAKLQSRHYQHTNTQTFLQAAYLPVAQTTASEHWRQQSCIHYITYILPHTTTAAHKHSKILSK